MSYLEIIQFGIGVFPLAALIITIPFVLFQYKKNNAVNKSIALVFYSMVLYMICAYFLIILPLPDFDYVSKLTTQQMQLKPFNFIRDFFKSSGFVLADIKTYLPAFKSFAFLQAAFNVLLTVPFGLYLRYYFKFSFKKTVLSSFLLSLFFELTQLSGLYFIYPRSYRLFDVDDLILNTSGGVIGYFLYDLLKNILPSQKKLNQIPDKSFERFNGLKRIGIFVLDFLIYSVISDLISKSNFIKAVIFILYFALIPVLFKGKTIGSAFFNTVIAVDRKGILINFLKTLFLFINYLFVPELMIYIVNKVIINYGSNSPFLVPLGIISIFVFPIYYISCIFSIIFRNKVYYDDLFHVKSKTLPDE